jgi:hypothetical protein
MWKRTGGRGKEKRESGTVDVTGLLFRTENTERKEKRKGGKARSKGGRRREKEMKRRRWVKQTKKKDRRRILSLCHRSTVNWLAGQLKYWSSEPGCRVTPRLLGQDSQKKFGGWKKIMPETCNENFIPMGLIRVEIVFQKKEPFYRFQIGYYSIILKIVGNFTGGRFYKIWPLIFLVCRATFF